METAISLACSLFALGLVGLGCISSAWANRHHRWLAKAALMLTLGSLASGLIAAGFLLSQMGSEDRLAIKLEWSSGLHFGVLLDSLSTTMFILVSFIGSVIVRFSFRYLDGEATQGRFFRWLSFTIGVVLCLVISSNLIQFFAAWLLTSLGLHQLLIHYPNRSGAIIAARKKFLISRLGDILLIAAFALTYATFGSFEFETIFQMASKLQSDSVARWDVTLIGLLAVLGAMTKSAQFPWHTWLPDTMETPTPVSALMHAGIINAGGYLVIRLSPLISLSHVALDLLAWFGAITALYGAMVMLTQTSVKRSLAYSTIAQMGFMMFQCGLGAFSAALLHIVAHSLYKAHAFLSTGSVLENAAKTQWSQASQRPSPSAALTLLVAVCVSLTCTWVSASYIVGSLASKPGGIALAAILTLSLTELSWRTLRSSELRVRFAGLAAAVCLASVYFIAYRGADWLWKQSVSYAVVTPSLFDSIITGVAVTAFVLMFTLQSSLVLGCHNVWLSQLYVHASNGFYIDVLMRRIADRLWPRRALAVSKSL